MWQRRTFLQFSGSLALVAVMHPPWLEIEVWSSLGQPLDSQILSQIYFLNLEDEPLPLSITGIAPGKVSFQAPPIPLVIALKMEVLGFGEVTLYADNQGRGYTSADFPLHLNLAFAQSRLYRVAQAVKIWQGEGIIFSLGTLDRLAKARHYLRGSPSLEAIHLSLAESLWAGEEAVFRRAQQTLVPRANFLFGVNFFLYPEKGEKYLERFAQVFNFATVPFYWQGIEPVLGKPDFTTVDIKVPRLRQAQIEIKGHPLVWFHSAGIPEALRTKSYSEVKRLVAERVETITARYRGQINYFDIINEPHALSWANELGYSLEQFLELTQIAATASFRGNPEVVRIINNCCLWAENVPYHAAPQYSPYTYLRACLERQIPFEVIGLQFYYPEQDMFEINRLLERFARLGKPIHITEIGVSSSPEDDQSAYLQETRGLWHQPWSESIQADWLEQFYTLCYSKPFIQAISWWDLVDGGSFWPHGGLLHADLTPKLAFKRLQFLLEQWQENS
jgi:GH35 family endo-1,4-beta-xylanase